MSLSDPVPANESARQWPEGWACALAGSAGAAAILVLVGLRQVAPVPGLAALAFVVLAAALLFSRVRGEAQRQEVAPPPSAEDPLRQAAAAAALEGLPYPLLVVLAPPADDLSGGRIAFSNAAARDFLRLQGEGAPLATAMRNPEVLEIVDEALFGDIAAQTAYETGGASERFWRALARPLPRTPDGSRMALLLLTDETDARRNERMRSDFLANASHELRTPLASLTGFIETLRGHAKDDPAARDRFLEIMAAQADRMARLVADLMSLSRIELNEHIAPEGKVDVAMAVMDVIDALAPQAAAAGVSLRPVLPPAGAAVVIGDRDQIVQVVQNLIDNAVKYSGYAGDAAAVTIEVEAGLNVTAAQAQSRADRARLSLLTPDRAEDAYVLLRIADTGPGIARECLPRLTERFYRVEGQKSGDAPGTGLGLAIVKHILNRHRGGLTVESAPGQGAAFLAYFPVAPTGRPQAGAGWEQVGPAL